MNKTTKYISIFLTFILMLSSFTFGYSVPSKDYSNLEYTEGVLLVQFEKNLPSQAKASIRDANDVVIDKALNNTGLERVILKGNRPLHSVINQLEGMSGVVFAEPDYTVYATPINAVYVPEGFVNPLDDTHYGLLWGLHNTGQTIRTIPGDGFTDIDAPEAWNLSTGSNTVIVAVIDEAVDMTHPDLQGVVIDYKKFNTGGTAYEHGTHVAGTIAANDNALGVVGVAPNVKIMSLSFLGSNGGSTSNAILAINYAKDHGAHIINASWGGGAYSQALKDAIENFGGPFVAASGNEGINTDLSPHYPSSYSSSNIISVAAVSNTGQLADFSNYGASSVDIAAPGVDIVSTYPGGYAYMSGTSMATPHVAGILALMKSYNPQATTNALIQALYESGRSLSSLNGKTATGKLADTDNALLTLGSGSVEPPVPSSISVTTTSPVNNQTNVKRSANIIFTFDKVFTSIDSTKIILKDSSGTPVNFTHSGLNTNKLTINPGPTLSSLTKYTIVLSEGAVSSSTATLSPYTLSFTTGKK